MSQCNTPQHFQPELIYDANPQTGLYMKLNEKCDNKYILYLIYILVVFSGVLCFALL